jgi:hypothetical protein
MADGVDDVAASRHVGRRSRWWRFARKAAVALAVVALAIQFVPYGWWHENPPVVLDAPWSAAPTRTTRA